MTTSTTDAEAIARIIDPEGMQAYSEAKATGRLADNGQLWADCLYGDRRKTATSRAAAILSYLASRREAQEPAAGELLPCPFCGSAAEIERYGTPSVSTVYRCTECACRLETGEEWNHGAYWNRRTAPPAPTGEVERSALEPVLSFLDELAANGQPGQRKALNPVLIGGSAKLYAEGLRAALNGGKNQ